MGKLKSVLNATTQESLRLGPPVGSGGEQTVFSTPDAPGIALAIPHQMSADKEDRLRFLLVWTVAIGLLKHFAWPLNLLLDESGRVVGYTMRLVKGVLLSTYLHPATRPASISLLWMLKVFHQISECVHAGHASGFRIGDLNCNNIMVKPDGSVVMLDVGSFYVAYQQRVFSTDSAVGQYVSPELMDAFDKGVLANQARTVHQDSFAFAILLFKALMDGFHPFSNREMEPVESVMKACEWPYDTGSSSFHPKTASPAITELPPKLLDLFQRCFGVGLKDPTKRPSTIEWHQALGEWIQAEEQHQKAWKAGKPQQQAQSGSVASTVPTQKPSLLTPIALLAVVVLSAVLLFSEPAKSSPRQKGKKTGKETPQLWMDLHQVSTRNGVYL